MVTDHAELSAANYPILLCLPNGATARYGLRCLTADARASIDQVRVANGLQG